jgi:Ca-activated chloride channel family protein
VKRRGIDVVFALDTSLSMLARDLPPSRFERAKHEISRILDHLEGDRVALVAFAGAAYVQCPFTLDYGAFLLFLEHVGVGSAPKAGSDLAAAIERSAALLKSDEKKYKALVLFSDGEALSGEALAAARAAATDGVRIFVAGAGTAAGGVIPLVDESGNAAGVKRDEAGEVVVTRLDEASLAEIARAGGGTYVPLGGAGDPGAEIATEIESFEKKDLTSRTAIQFEERHAWFSLAAFLFLAAEFLLPDGRRGGRRPEESAA